MGIIKIQDAAEMLLLFVAAMTLVMLIPTGIVYSIGYLGWIFRPYRQALLPAFPLVYQSHQPDPDEGCWKGQGGLPHTPWLVSRIERTLFILDWLQNVDLRRRVQAGT